MNKYQCQVCGAVSYSSASQENLKDDSCLECDGRVEMVDGDKMNADEIVKKIRSANICDIAIARMEAADLIESLQAQLAASQRRAQDARNELCQAIAAWNRRAEPENKPLTLDELKQMDGKPVWTVGVGANKCKSYYALVMLSRKSVYTVIGDEMVQVGALCQYGKTWLAYRAKPKEEHHETD